MYYYSKTYFTIIFLKGEKPYKCRYCDARFAQTSNCKTHENTHLKSDGYRCMLCNKRLLRLSGLIRHIKNHHKIVISATEVGTFWLEKKSFFIKS